MARYSDTNGSRNQITQERAESQLTDSLCIIVSGVRCRSSNDVAFSPHDRVSNVAIAKIYIHTRFNKNTDKKFLRNEKRNGESRYENEDSKIQDEYRIGTVSELLGTLESHGRAPYLIVQRRAR